MFRHYVYDLVTPIASNTQTKKGCFLGRVGEGERDGSISWFKMSITSGVTSSSESHSDRRSVIKEMLWGKSEEPEYLRQPQPHVTSLMFTLFPLTQ